jgi:hypothetical protein
MTVNPTPGRIGRWTLEVRTNQRLARRPSSSAPLANAWLPLSRTRARTRGVLLLPDSRRSVEYPFHRKRCKRPGSEEHSQVEEADLANESVLLDTIFLTIGLSVLLQGLTAAPLAARYAAWFAAHPRDAEPAFESAPAPEHRLPEVRA